MVHINYHRYIRNQATLAPSSLPHAFAQRHSVGSIDGPARLPSPVSCLSLPDAKSKELVGLSEDDKIGSTCSGARGQMGNIFAALEQDLRLVLP